MLLLSLATLWGQAGFALPGEYHVAQQNPAAAAASPSAADKPFGSYNTLEDVALVRAVVWNRPAPFPAPRRPVKEPGGA